MNNRNWDFGGHKGFRFLDSTFAPTGDEANESFFAIQVTADAVLTLTNADGGDVLTAKTIPAGMVVYGKFLASVITVASGEAIAYIL